MTAECTTDDCGNWTETYLCGRCVDDLQAWLDKVPVLVEALTVTVHKLDHVRPAGGGGGGGAKPGSAAPINLDALQLQENLRTVGTSAAWYATRDHAAGSAWLIQDWVTKAELLVSGPEMEYVNHAANREKVRNIAPPMPTRQLLPWLRTHAKIAITSMDVRDWARRGKLTPVEREPQPTYHPHEVLAAWHDTRAGK